MQLARVIGDIVASHKDENLSSLKLLVLQPLAADGSEAGRTLVAVDAIGAAEAASRVRELVARGT